jgi:hypothetical protein
MQADKVEVSWDATRKKWLIRIIVGEEVIRRYCNDAQNTDQSTLRASARQTAADEGYSVDDSNIVIH